jgi:hypothetical protein
LFNYHASTIAEFLNNIRWAIFKYVQPEFERSYEKIAPEPMYPEPMYRFRYPADITQPIARAMYWDLMNMARSSPFFLPFTVSGSLKSQF